MSALKTILVGAATCAALIAAPVLAAPPASSTAVDDTEDVKVMSVHGDRVAYRDEGQGDVILLIHGMGGSSETWSGVIPRLAEKYRVIAPDLLGHGQSDKPRGDYSVGAFAVMLRDLLDELGVTRVTVVGHSLGGGIAMQFAHQHRQYCERLVLISSGGFGGDVGSVLRLLSIPGSEFVLPMIASRPAIAAGNALRALAGSADRFDSRPALSNRDTRKAFLRTLRSVIDYRGQTVSAINRLCCSETLPALIISGDEDRIIPVDHARAANATMPNSRLHVLEGVGHHPPTEEPEMIADLIDEFVGAHVSHTEQ
jgi:pimeloyl-ACP methyl ester carboxylesterase